MFPLPGAEQLSSGKSFPFAQVVDYCRKGRDVLAFPRLAREVGEEERL